MCNILKKTECYSNFFLYTHVGRYCLFLFFSQPNLFLCNILCFYKIPIFHFKDTGCPKNGVLTVHYGVEEITVNARKMFKQFYWTYFLIWRSLNVALNRSIILKYMYEIVMTATSNRTYYHKVQDHSLPISNPA
jgi:hypothetical protein